MIIVLFIAVLLVTVLVHEWGHYIAAKKSGMLVEEFGFGIPPRLWSWKKGETRYSINVLPIGGFVKIAGENGEDLNAPHERQFESKPWYIKSLVLIAGVIMNVALAIVLFATAYTIGMPGMTDSGTPTVVSVVQGSPTQAAGVAVGDTVQSVVIDKKIVDVLDTDKIHEAIASSKGDVTITYTHKGESHTAVITPSAQRLIGVAIEPIGVIKQPFFKALGLAWQQSMSLIGQIVTAIGTLVGGLLHGHGSTEGLVGPVGLAREVGNAATFGITYLLAFIATISLNLAVLNILPFPALDGGRLIVVWGEAITKRKFSSTVVGLIHGIGFLILIALMVALTVGDIRKAI